MAIREMPALTSNRRNTTAYAVSDLGAQTSTSNRLSNAYNPTDFTNVALPTLPTLPHWPPQVPDQPIRSDAALQKLMALAEARSAAPPEPKPQPQKEKKTMAKNTRRLVQVVIVDPDSRVPVDQSIVYMGAQKLTDFDDSELFFELDIKSLLEAHNAKRTQVVNKAVKDRTEYLEPARVRDLRMNFIVAAEFAA